MTGAVSTYVVTDATSTELLGRLLQAIQKENRADRTARFWAKANDTPEPNEELRMFEVRVEAVLLHGSIAVQVLDQDNNWFQMVLLRDQPVTFEIATP